MSKISFVWKADLSKCKYLEIDTLDSEIASNEVFGTVEAVKTVSDLFMPISGKVISKDFDLIHLVLAYTWFSRHFMMTKKWINFF